MGLKPDVLYVCASGATSAGLVFGRKALDLPYAVEGIAPILSGGYDVPASVAETANAPWHRRWRWTSRFSPPTSAT